jgi:hypothetical protein
MLLLSIALAAISPVLTAQAKAKMDAQAFSRCHAQTLGGP